MDGELSVGADLHCHTRMSDGSVGIDELIYLAKRLNVTTISITDHDTFAGAKRGMILGKRFGVNVIMGAEVSAFDFERKRRVHILCYLCDNPDRLEGLFKRISEERKKTAAIILQKIMRLYPISPEMVSKRAIGGTNIFKQHIMHALVDAGYERLIFGELHDKLFNRETGIVKYNIEYPSVYEIIDLIHASGGLAVLAHPYKYDSIELMQELASKKVIDGIEVWSPGHDKEKIEFLSSFAIENDLVPTGGSDFHGMYSADSVPLGAGSTPVECLNLLMKKKHKLYSK